MTSPPIPFEPDPTLDEAKARFDLAVLAGPYVAGESPRPGEQRQHVFDFEEGLRLIVSRDTRTNPRNRRVSAEGIAVSASLDTDETRALYEEVKTAVEANQYPGVPAGNVATALLSKAAQTRFVELSGYGGKVKPTQISPSGVVHFWITSGNWSKHR